MGTRILRYVLSWLFALWYLLVGSLVPVQAADQYDVLCPDSDNPLNIPFEMPNERLITGPIAMFGAPVLMDFIDPRDVACKTNFDDVTIEKFRRAVNCELTATNTVTCTVDPKCTAQRKEILHRLQLATVRALNEVVIKSKGIHFFNLFQGAKRILFDDTPLAHLTGIEIAKRSLTGKTNIVNNFSYGEFRPPDRAHFDEFFSKLVELYVKIRTAEKPTGLVARRSTCVGVSQTPHVTEKELNECYNHLLTSYKNNRVDVGSPDEKLIGLLDEALKLIVNFLWERAEKKEKKEYQGLKIPFTGHCIGSSGVEPNTVYSDLHKISEFLNTLP